MGSYRAEHRVLVMRVVQTCYDWFCKGIADLEPDTQSQLFQKEILKLDLNKLTPTGRQLFGHWMHFFAVVLYITLYL